MPKTRSSSSGGGALFATGTYTGDGAATQAIAGVGFQPRYIMIIRQTDPTIRTLVEKNDQDGLFASVYIGSDRRFAYAVDMIISLDADGFTVGDGTGLWNVVNLNAVNYNYTCFG